MLMEEACESSKPSTPVINDCNLQALRYVYTRENLLALRHGRKYLLASDDPIRALPLPSPLSEAFLRPNERTSDVISVQPVSFSAFALAPSLLRALEELNVLIPSPIQAAALPATTLGLDVIVQAKSGTGKTLVFALTAMHVAMESDALSVIVLAPTRELCTQIIEVMHNLGNRLVPKIEATALIGGVDEMEDANALSSIRPRIVVGTPGRVDALVSKGLMEVSKVKLLVLDEADRLLDGALGDAVPSVCSILPEGKQSIAVSATFSEKLKRTLERVMRRPMVIRVGEGEALLGVRQRKITIGGGWKEKMKRVIGLLKRVDFGFCIVFTNERGCGKGILGVLKDAGFTSEGMHAEVGQKERERVMKKVGEGKVKCLITTDLLARGVEVEGCDLVVHMDLPERDVYLHRVGRAGRYGRTGLSILVGKGFEGLERRLGFAIKELNQGEITKDLQILFRSDVGDEKKRGRCEKHGSLKDGLSAIQKELSREKMDRNADEIADVDEEDKEDEAHASAENEVEMNGYKASLVQRVQKQSGREEKPDTHAKAKLSGNVHLKPPLSSERTPKRLRVKSEKDAKPASLSQPSPLNNAQQGKAVHFMQPEQVPVQNSKTTKLLAPQMDDIDDLDDYAKRAFDEGYQKAYERAYQMAMHLGKRLGWQKGSLQKG